MKASLHIYIQSSAASLKILPLSANKTGNHIVSREARTLRSTMGWDAIRWARQSCAWLSSKPTERPATDARLAVARGLESEEMN
jgi:hypothetical protein